MSQLEVIQLKRDLREAKAALGKYKRREAGLRTAMEQILATPGQAVAIANAALGRPAGGPNE